MGHSPHFLHTLFETSIMNTFNIGISLVTLVIAATASDCEMCSESHVCEIGDAAFIRNYEDDSKRFRFRKIEIVKDNGTSWHENKLHASIVIKVMMPELEGPVGMRYKMMQTETCRIKQFY